MSKKNMQLCIRVDEETFEILEKYAKEEDRSVAYIVRKLIDNLITEKKLKEKSNPKDGKNE